MGKRFQIIAKWGTLLLIISLIMQFLVPILMGVIMALSGQSESSALSLSESLSPIISMMLTLPFAYIFTYKATLEYLRFQYKKGSGWNFGFSVVLFAALLTTVINFVLTQQLSYSLGVLPIIIGIIAGKRAEQKFSSK